MQKEILEIIPQNRLSNRAKELKCILKRKFSFESSLYRHSGGHCGSVSSPIAGKKLNNNRWVEIITNKKLENKRHSNWKEGTGGFVESSIEEFSRSFSNAVSEEPERMIKLVLSHNEGILDVYIDSLFSGAAYSKAVNDVPVELLETMILKYSYDYDSYRANSICTFIEKRENVEWSQEILEILKDIAVNHKNPEIDKPNVTNSEDKEMRSFDLLQSNSINCVRGAAAQAIAHLLWKDCSFFEQFKDTIEKLLSDKNPAVKLASLYALWPSYNIDREWASKKIIKLYEEDYRLAGFHDTKNMFFLLHPNYRELILKIIKKCYDSTDIELIRMGTCCLSEMFILNGEFTDIMNNVDSMSKEQAESVLHMAILYFDKEKYNSLVKNIISKFKTSKFDLEMELSRLFYDNRIDLERDKDFLIEIMNSGISHKMVHAFVHYLEEKSRSVVDYNDIILSMSDHLIQSGYNKEIVWGIEDEISKLIIGLYDETSGSTQPELRDIAKKCLNIWDLMFEKQIGPVRKLSREMMER